VEFDRSTTEGFSVALVDPGWSLATLLRDYRPHPSWRAWFTEAYARALESPHPDERLAGWKTAAIIFGDMHAPVFCLFVCRHGRTLVAPDSLDFLGHIDLCLMDLGLARPARPDGSGTLPISALGNPEALDRDEQAAAQWLAEQLSPFDGDAGRAATFAMRLTAAKFGLLNGPVDPTIAQVLDESLWERRFPGEPGAAPDPTA
jgi:hypothetical protein